MVGYFYPYHIRVLSCGVVNQPVDKRRFQFLHEMFRVSDRVLQHQPFQPVSDKQIQADAAIP
jgi:hypothetical protein